MHLPQIFSIVFSLTELLVCAVCYFHLCSFRSILVVALCFHLDIFLSLVRQNIILLGGIFGELPSPQIYI